MTHETPSAACPVCGVIFTRASNADGSNALPKPGAFTVCMYCAAILEFGEDLHPMPITEEGYRVLSSNAELAAVLGRTARAIRIARHKRSSN
jgi:hypothetical protein